MKDRYIRNIGTLSKEEMTNLKKYKVCVVGCGGLGGYIIEMLGRLGIGYITAVDKDVFDETNLNRQILSDTTNLGRPKAIVAFERMKLVNPDVVVNPIVSKLTEENGKEILEGHNLVIDALDNIPTKLLLEKLCEELNLPMIYGAIAGWYAQVSTIFPGDGTLSKIYHSGITRGVEKELGNPSFTPALAAALQISEALKVLLKRGELLREKILFIDTFENEYYTIQI